MSHPQPYTLISSGLHCFPGQSSTLHTNVQFSYYSFYAASQRDRLTQSIERQLPLKHPHLAQVLEVKNEDSEGLMYTVVESELVASLEDEVRKRIAASEQWNESEVRRMLQEIASVMLYLESQGLVCTDLTPDNIAVAGDKFQLKSLVFSDVWDLVPVNLATLSPERRRQVSVAMLGDQETEELQFPRKSALYSLAVIAVWMIAPEGWGRLQTPAQFSAFISQVSSQGDTASILQGMLEQDPALRLDWNAILKINPSECTEGGTVSDDAILRNCQRAFREQNWSHLQSSLSQLIGKVSATTSIACQKCQQETTLDALNAICSAHLTCGKCTEGQTRCGLCPPRKRVLVVRPAAASAVCRTCSRAFTYCATDEWRMNFTGSAIINELSDICSEECVPSELLCRSFPQEEAQGLQESYIEEEKEPRDYAFPQLSSIKPEDRTVYVGDWLKLSHRQKREKIKEIKTKWNFRVTDEAAIIALDGYHAEKAENRRKNLGPAFLMMMGRYNGDTLCHFCHRDIPDPCEAIWTVCDGRMRGVCSPSCFQSSIPADALAALADYPCPGCGLVLEGRRLLESSTFETIRDVPHRQFGFDCEFCLTQACEEMECGHLRCAGCRDKGREDCYSCGKGEDVSYDEFLPFTT